MRSAPVCSAASRRRPTGCASARSCAWPTPPRTRCTYFRDVSYQACNKRTPGSGCAAMDGFNRDHAVLGTSDSCIATYPGDFAQAMMALDARVEVLGADGARTIPFAALHRRPGATPDVE